MNNLSIPPSAFQSNRFLLKAMATAFLLTLLASIAFGQNCPNNLLSNPGFENGLNSWSTLEGNPSASSMSVFSGSNSLEMGNTPNQAHVVNQALSASPNTTYSLVFQGRKSNNGNYVSQARLKFYSSSWLPIQTEFGFVETSNFQQNTISATSPANAAFVGVEFAFTPPNAGDKVFIDDVCLTTGSVGGGLPDLVPVVQPGVTSAANNETLTFSVAVKNEGQGSASPDYFQSYQGYLSDDPILSSNDQYLNNVYGSLQPQGLAPGQTSDFAAESYTVPANNSFNGTKYIIIAIDHLDGIEESDETNNHYALPVQISTIPTPTTCTETIGPGDLLCWQKNGNNLDVFLENNLIVSKFTLNEQGTVISSQNGGSLITDSILVQGNQVIKKLYNGAIVYTKAIPQSVLDSIPTVQAAAELTDGTLVLAGYRQNLVTNPPSSPAINSLVLVNTDANLNPLEFRNKLVSQVSNPFFNFNDFVKAIYPLPNGAFDIFYSNTASTLTTFQALVVNRFTFNDPASFNDIGKSVGALVNSGSVQVTKTHCNTYRYIGPTGYIGQKGHFFGNAMSFYDISDLSLISSQRDGLGSLDYYGSYDSWTFVSTSPDSLMGSFQYRSTTDPVPDMRFVISQPGQQQLAFDIPYFNYVHAALIDPTTVFLFGKNNGQTFVQVATECYPPNALMPDLTGDNLQIANTLQYEPGDILQYVFHLKNNGTGATSTTIDYTLWISDDPVLDANDLAWETVTTNPLTANNQRNEGNSFNLPSNLAGGTYYLLVEIDPANTIVETDEENNVLSYNTPFTVNAGMADLTVTSVDCPSNFPDINGDVTWNGVVKNNGTGISQPTDIYLYSVVPGAMGNVSLQLGSYTVPALGAGQSANFSISVPASVHAPTAGQAGLGEKFLFTSDFGLSFLPDLNGGYPEFHETNVFPDIYCKTFSTDLRTELSTSQTNLSPTDPLAFTMTVTNNGPADAWNITSLLHSSNSGTPFSPSFSAQTNDGLVWERQFPQGAGTFTTNQIWHIPFLAVGETATVSVTLTPVPGFSEWPSSGVLINRLADSGHNNEINPNDNTDVLNFTVDGGLGNFIDLELSATANPPNPTIWSNTSVELVLENKGNIEANSVKVRFYKPENTVFTGGNEYTASQGTFETAGNTIWDVGSIPAGGSATLTVNLFIMTEEGRTAFVQVEEANEVDADSSPGNGNPFIPNEDDEAAADINGGVGGGDCDVSVNFAYPFCDNNGTPNDDGDDVFYFAIRASGTNTSSSWTSAFQGQQLSGPYNTTLQYGPYPFSAAKSIFTIADATDPNCTASVTIQAPLGGTCSGGGGGQPCTNNLLQNGDFENGLNGWNIAPGSSAGVSTTSDAYSGNTALRMDADQQTIGSTGISQEVTITDPNGQYVFSLFGKRIWDIAPDHPADGFVRIFYKNAAGTILGNDPINHILATSFNEYSKLVTLPVGTAAVLIEITLFSSGDFGSGSIILDDLCFRKTGGNPTPDLSIVSVECPNEYPGPDVDVTWDITVQNNSTTAVANQTEIYLWNSFLAPLAKRLYGSTTIPALAPGATAVVSIAVPSTVYFPNPGQAGLGQDFIFTGLKYLSFDPNGDTQDYTEADGFPDEFCKKFSTDLSIELTPITSTVTVNQPVTFQMTVTNNGPVNAYNVEADFDMGFAALGFPIPDVTAVISKGEFWRQDFSGGGTQPYRFFWYLPFLASGESASAEVTIDPALFAANVDYVINRTVSSGHNIDPNPSNNMDEIIIPYANSGGDIDLELSLTQPNANPAQWSSYPVVLTINNAGPQTATGVKVKFAKPNGVVYTGGNEFTASQGTFNAFSDEVWTVGSIPAGGSATLTVNYFLLNATAPTAYAQVTAANEQDVDSTPNNGTPPSVNEDDEASTSGGGPQCSLTAQWINKACHDNNTPNDSSDDTFTFDILVTGTDTSPNGWTANVGSTIVNGTYGTPTNAGSFLISDGNVSVVIKDQDDPGCEKLGLAVPPPPCSDVPICEITVESLGTGCHNNGTPNDPSDDRFQVNLLVNGSNTGPMGWRTIVNGNQVVGDYGVNETIGFYNIADGAANIFVRDVEFDYCNQQISVQPPAPCSVGPDLPDLVIADGSLEPNPVGQGHDLTFNLLVENVGNGAASGSMSIQVMAVGFGQVGITNPSPINLAAGASEYVGFTFPITFPPGIYDLEINLDVFDDIEETNDANNSLTLPIQINPTFPEIDLELNLIQANANPAQWSSYPVELTINNAGPQTATGVKVKFAKPNGVVYTGGNEFTASQGIFNAFSDEVWTVGSIPAGGSATLEVSYFLLANTAPVAYAQVITANEQDADSTPNNGTPPTVNEDDEASTVSGQGPDKPDLEIQVFSSVFELGPSQPPSQAPACCLITNFTVFNYTNVTMPGSQDALYLSTDPVFSSDDILIETYSRSDKAPGQGDVVGEIFTDLSNIQPGDYYVILFIDHLNAVDEANEMNNMDLATVTVPNLSVGPDLQLSMETDASMTWPLDARMFVTATLENRGSDAATGVKVAFSDLLGAEIFFDPSTHIPSQGTFDNASQIWDVGTVSPSGQAALVIRLANNSEDTYRYFAQVSEMNEMDPDSSPGNATCCDPIEDDEAVVPPGPCNIEAEILQILECIPASAPPTDELVYEVQVSGALGGFHGYFGEPGPIYSFPTDVIFERTVPRYETRPDVIIDNADPKCQTTLSFPKPSCDNSTIDLQLDFHFPVSPLPPIYNDYPLELRVYNTGGIPATGVVIHFPKPDGTVYVGGNEWSATQGTFVPFAQEEWTVGTIPAGESATLTVNYFLLTGNGIMPYAQVVAANETDSDSTPNNGTCCTANEDDEVAANLNNGGSGSPLQIRDDRQRIAFNRIYPNPSKYWVSLEIYSKEDQAAVLDFYNQLGQSVHHMEVDLRTGRNNIEVQVSDWKSGTYNVIGRGNGTPAYGRFLKVWE